MYLNAVLCEMGEERKEEDEEREKEKGERSTERRRRQRRRGQKPPGIPDTALPMRASYRCPELTAKTAEGNKKK